MKTRSAGSRRQMLGTAHLQVRRGFGLDYLIQNQDFGKEEKFEANFGFEERF